MGTDVPRNAEFSRSFLYRLLFIEVCLLAAIAGLLAWRYAAPGGLLLALVLGLDWLRGENRGERLQRSFVLIVCAVLGCAYVAWREPAPPPVPPWLTQAAYVAEQPNGDYHPPQVIRLQATIVSCTPLPGNSARVILADAYPLDSATRETYKGRIVWIWYKARPELLLPGQTIHIDVRLSPQRGFANPETFDTQRYWADRGVWFRAWSSGLASVELNDSPRRMSAFAANLEPRTRVAALRRDLLHAFKEVLAHQPDGSMRPSGAVLLAVLFGDRSGISPHMQDLFARSTLAHSLALSGLHLGFAALAGYFLSRGLGWVFPRLWHRVPRPAFALTLSLPIAILYLWLGQAPASLQRAFYMLVFWTILVFFHRSRVILDGLLAAVAFLLILEPLSLFDLGLQLSALSVATIALCLPTIQRVAAKVFPYRIKDAARLSERPSIGAHQQKTRPAIQTSDTVARFGRGAVTIAGLSLCIQTALLPLTASAFGTAGVLFPLNVLWLPVLGCFVLPASFFGLGLTAIGLEHAAGYVLWLASIPCDALIALLNDLDQRNLLIAPLMPRPHWTAMAGYWLLFLATPGAVTYAMARMRKIKSRLGLGKKVVTGMPSVADVDNPSEIRGEVRDRRSDLLGLNVTRCVLICMALGLYSLPSVRIFFEQRTQAVSLRLIDVGQGQSVLIEWTGLGPEKESGRALIDGGGFSSRSFDTGKALLTPILTYEAPAELEYVINSHPDMDHLGGLLYILERFQVGEYMANGDLPTPALAQREEWALHTKGIEKRILRQGECLPLAPELELEVLWPPADAMAELSSPGKSEKGNNASLILRLVWRNTGLALICGDAEALAITALMRRHPFTLKAQALVLPHHGSASSFVPGFYQSVAPKLALASCGYGNRWGFPSYPVRRALQELRVPLVDTGRAGQIHVRWSAPDTSFVMSTARTAP